MKKFDLTNSVVEGTEWFSRLAIVNLLWLIFSMPLVTLIPSTDALFQVMNDWSNGDTKKPIFRTFTHYFKQNFWSSFKIGLPFFLIIIILSLDSWFLDTQIVASTGIQIYKYALYTFGLLFGLTFLYTYPLSKKVNLSVFRLYLSGMVVMISQPITSLIVLASLIILAIVLLKWPALFFFFSASVFAWIATLAMNIGYKKTVKKQLKIK